ncbi:MAG: rhomboid family intramembrane serine protease [Euryarchaeota archaeon]|nr:rhomboid family intramembrane serine protease [Euryarchaeota archaeon]
MKVTTELLLANIGVYSVLAVLSGNPLELDDRWVHAFGLYNQSFLAGAYYQVLTSLFFHFDLPHLGYNMLFLAIFGYRAEDIYGRKRFLAIYLATGVIASLLTLYHVMATSSPELKFTSAGASGAIFGILGAVLIAQRNLYSGGVRTSLLYGFLFFILAKSTGFLAHLIGLVAGFLMGYALTWDWYPRVEEQDIDFDEAAWEEVERQVMEEIERERRAPPRPRG